MSQPDFVIPVDGCSPPLPSPLPRSGGEGTTPCDQICWDDFLAGELSPVIETQAVHHLDTCSACQQRVETLAGETQWWRESQLYLSPERADAGGPISLPDERDDVEAGDRPPDIPLDFLAPTDDPESVGRLGTYEVRGVIGRGGTGIVVKAFDRGLNRFVAIKALDPHLAGNAAARKRFAREGRAAAAVAHEQIVPIHAVSEQQGLPYIVMQYVPGRSLQQRIDQEGPLALADVLRIGLQTAQGLAAAHAQGLVHRDVKPANILLENGIERVLLTDFGLARTIDEASLTQSGVIAGTPQYMAPEQARGETVDHRTDLFSLGSVLYAMCTGHSPFRAETTMGVLHRICHATPRPIQATNPQVPLWLSAIISRLHAKHPSKRYHSAADVAEILKRQLARLQSPGGALGLSWTEAMLVTRAWLGQERRKLIGFGGVAAVVLLAFALGRNTPQPVVHPVGDAAYVTAPPNLPVEPPHDSPAERPVSTLADVFLSEAAWNRELEEIDGQLSQWSGGWFTSPAGADDWGRMIEELDEEWRRRGWPRDQDTQLPTSEQEQG